MKVQAEAWAFLYFGQLFKVQLTRRGVYGIVIGDLGFVTICFYVGPNTS